MVPPPLGVVEVHVAEPVRYHQGLVHTACGVAVARVEGQAKGGALQQELQGLPLEGLEAAGVLYAEHCARPG